MKPKTVMTLAVAVGCGLVAALLMKQAGSKTPVQQEPRVAVLTVVEQIGTGERVAGTKVKFKEVPKSVVPEGAITSADQYEDRAVKSPAQPGEFLTLDRLGEKGVYGPSILIEPGYRVIGVPVDASNSFSGMLQPGDRVDVLVTFKSDMVNPITFEKTSVTKTSTLLEYVKIFATDNRRIDNGGDTYESDSTGQAHLLLTPEQATWIKLAQEKGRLSLAWRSELDTELADVGTIGEGLIAELKGAVGGVGDQPRYEEENPFAERPNDEDLADAEDDYEEEDTGDFSDFLAQAAEDSEDVSSSAGVWTMEIYSGTDAELIEVPMPVSPVRDAPSAEDASAMLDNAEDKPSAIGTSATLLRQFLLGL